MNEVRTAIFIVLTFSGALQAQTLALRGDTCMFNASRAANLMFMTSELAARETTVLVYVKRGFSFRGPDSTDYRFTADSIRGRGDKRDALLTMSYKTSDSTAWWWGVPREAFGPYIVDTVAHTSDSTHRWSQWLSYTRKLWSAEAGTWYLYSDTTHPAVMWQSEWLGYPYDWRLNIRMEKILGDPTKYNGRDQRAVLKVSYFQTPSDSLYRQLVNAGEL